MENTFKSYDPPRISKSKDYQPGGRFQHTQAGNRVLCSNCGQPFGKHSAQIYNNNCPTKDQMQRIRQETKWFKRKKKINH